MTVQLWRLCHMHKTGSRNLTCDYTPRLRDWKVQMCVFLPNVQTMHLSSACLLMTQLQSLSLFYLLSISLCLSPPPSLSCNSSICRGPSVLHLGLQKLCSLLKTYTWSQLVNTASAQPVNYDFTNRASLIWITSISLSDIFLSGLRRCTGRWTN